MKSLFDDGALSLVHSVGYPNQNRSHFRSTDIWTSGSAADQMITTGWLGRYYQGNHPTFPAGYPNTDYPDPLAITVGGNVSETCQGPIVNFSRPSMTRLRWQLLPEPIYSTSIPPTNYGNELKYIMTTLQQYTSYSDIIKNANTAAGGSIAPSGNALLDRLNIVSQLIKGGLKTKVYVVSIGTFDTHSNQCDPDDHELGTHAGLLQQLSDAMRGFQDSLKKNNLRNGVLLE
ncbi:MAG: hypothetical protein U0T81_03015 [Saprospiraceae bacterium]